MNMRILSLVFGFLCYEVCNVHATGADPQTQAQENGSIQKFIEDIDEKKKDGKDVYLVLGDQGQPLLNPGTPRFNGWTWNRFGDEKWTFWNISNIKHDRIGIRSDIRDLSSWQQLSEKIPDTFTYIVDDFDLLQTPEFGQGEIDRGKVLDNIYKLLKQGGVLVSSLLGEEWYPSDKEIEDIYEKFEVYLVFDPIACFPHGSLGHPSGGWSAYFQEAISYLKKSDKSYLSSIDTERKNKLFMAARIAQVAVDFQERLLQKGLIDTFSQLDFYRRLEQLYNENNNLVKREMSGLFPQWDAGKVTTETGNVASVINIDRFKEYRDYIISALDCYNTFSYIITDLSFFPKELRSLYFVLKKK
jgi:SAM-dependent methyltransferase